MREDPHPGLDYIRKLTAPQDALLLGIHARLPEQFRSWQIGPEEGKMLQLFMRMAGVRRVVEIGTLAGYSTVWMARALPEDGHITTLNKDPEHNKIARDTFAACEVKDRITLLEGDALTLLPTLSGEFDMIFIDADKINYAHYLDWAEQHIKKGGLIIGDNSFLFGTVWQDAPPEGTAPATWNAMRAFNQRLSDPAKYVCTIIPTAEGMTVAIKL